MAISFSPESRVFKLDTLNTSYCFGVSASGALDHLYYGRKLSDSPETLLGAMEADAFGNMSFMPYREDLDVLRSRGVARCEYPGFGEGDFRHGAFRVTDPAGCKISSARYLSHRIVAGKAPIPGLPSSFPGATQEQSAETLEVTLGVEGTELQLVLFYTVFADSDVIARRVRAVHAGKGGALQLEQLLSASFDLPAGNYDLIRAHGTWAHERSIERTPIGAGTLEIGSLRMSSGHVSNPALAVVSEHTTESAGDVYAMMLVYSGSFEASVQRDSLFQVRCRMGIASEQFSWHLEPGEVFDAPEALLVYSDCGLGKMSGSYHDFLRNHVISPRWSKVKRPILINNWEATYFDFNTEKLLDIAKTASQYGIEMLVLDDGWFGARENDHSSLGDWFVNREKVGSLRTLSEELKKLSMQFGLWFEPEMISERSRLYEQHPDWVMTAPQRSRTLGRNQMVLNMSKPEVVDYLFHVMSDIIEEADLDYIKWDMNRQVAEYFLPDLPPERQGEAAHRYVLGVYQLLERLLKRFPDLLIEGCSGGGGRFDAGMLYYTPQIWTSDDSDAYERIEIQLGTSVFYPASAMGAHVSASPNHQTHRVSPYKMRGDVALFGTFGYELDLGLLSKEELEMTRSQVEHYHRYNALVTQGDLHRLSAPFTCLERQFFEAWEFAAKDASEALLVVVMTDFYSPQHPKIRLKLRGLAANGVYEWSDGAGSVVRRASGGALMNMGILVDDLEGDGASKLIPFKRIS